MKILLAIFVLILVIFTIATPITNDDVDHAMGDCQTEKNLTIKDINTALGTDFYKENAPKVSEDVRCYETCVYKKLGIVTANDTQSREGWSNILLTYGRRDEKKVAAAMEICFKEIDDTMDVCKQTSIVDTCFTKNT